MAHNKQCHCPECHPEDWVDGEFIYDPAPYLVTTYKGRPLDEYTKEELIKMVGELIKYYESRIESWKKMASIR